MSRDATAELRWRCDVCGGTRHGASRQAITCRGCGREYRRAGAIWIASADFEPDGFGAGRRDHLAALEEHHFWFRARAELLERRLRALLPRPRAHVLDLGCGTGSFLALALRSGARAVGVDAYGRSLARAAERAPGATLIQSPVDAVPLADAQAEVVACLDVLEHVEPRALLGEAHRLGRPGARLLLSVPAFPALWSALDEAAGHRCRYRLGTLRRELDGAGWRLDGHTHYQFLLFGFVWLSRRLSRSRARPLERGRLGPLGAALDAVNRFEVRAFAGRRLPWGSSLVAWATRRG